MNEIDRSEPTLENQLWHARKLSDEELIRHASVSIDNNDTCGTCFCCACVTVMKERGLSYTPVE